MRQCIEASIILHAPKPDTSANTKADTYGKSTFPYDADNDQYHCHGGQVLDYCFGTREKDPDLRYYRAKACKHCALKTQCARNQSNRTITREANEALMELMAAENEAMQGPVRASLRHPQPLMASVQR